MTEKEKIVDKIKKLLALSKSSNENEAALALENANKLLMKHNLEMSDISEIDIDSVIEDAVMSGGRMMTWKLSILIDVMNLNNCDIIRTTVIRGSKTIKAIGKKHNIDVSMTMFDYLIATMDRILKSKKDVDVFSFRTGFAHAIGKKIEKIIQERNKKNNDFDNACTALVVLEKALITKYLDDKYGNNLSSKVNKTYYKNADSFSKGFDAGQAVSLNSQIK